MSYTTTLQGSFTSTGSNTFIPLRSGVQWMKTINISAQATPTNLDTLSAYWQFGFPAAAASINKYIAASTACVETYVTTNGFTLIDTSIQATGNLNSTITAISTATPPVVTNTGVNGLKAGDIVRMINVSGGASGWSGIDFVVGTASLTNTTFSLISAPVLDTAGTTGSWEIIPFDPIFYPSHRVITQASSAGNLTVFATSIPHGYQVGQTVRINIFDPIYNQWVLANNALCTITNVGSPTLFTVTLNSSAFGTFTFPSDATVPFTPAIVVPVGENTPYAYNNGLNILSDATVNNAQIGMLLAGGTTGPAGAINDIIYWQAGVVFSDTNE